MNRRIATAFSLVVLAVSGTGMAQTSGGAPVATGAGAEAPAVYDLDTPIETIVADPAGKAVLDHDLPGLTRHPKYEQFKTMSLRDIQPFSEGVLTDAELAKTKADLAALKPK